MVTRPPMVPGFEVFVLDAMGTGSTSSSNKFARMIYTGTCRAVWLRWSVTVA